jgi:hypothetical protein
MAVRTLERSLGHASILAQDTDTAEPLPVAVLGELLGVPLGEQEGRRLKTWCNDFLLLRCAATQSALKVRVGARDFRSVRATFGRCARHGARCSSFRARRRKSRATAFHYHVRMGVEETSSERESGRPVEVVHQVRARPCGVEQPLRHHADLVREPLGRRRDEGPLTRRRNRVCSGGSENTRLECTNEYVAARTSVASWAKPSGPTAIVDEKVGSRRTALTSASRVSTHAPSRSLQYTGSRSRSSA